MRKSYLTEERIAELVRWGQTILTESDFKKLEKIGRKYNIELIYTKQANLQLWWTKIIEKMDELPYGDKFRRVYDETRSWGFRRENLEIIVAFFKYLDIYESEYLFLSSPKWNELNTFVCQYLGAEGVDSTGAESIFIKNKGDYYGYISQYAKKCADPESLKSTTILMKTLEGLTAGLSNTERGALAGVISQYLTAFDRPLDFDTLHNLLYKGQ